MAVPLDQPLYGASFPAAVRRFLAKYAMFSGRASRSEYWWWALAAAIVGLILTVLWNVAGGQAWLTYRELSMLPGMTNMAGAPGLTPATLSVGAIIVIVLYLIWVVGTIVPSLALTWRRLHDAGYAGLFYLLILIPFVGGIILLVLTLLPSNPSGARFDKPHRGLGTAGLGETA